MSNTKNIQDKFKIAFECSKLIFDRLAVWVIQLSWAKFVFLVIFLFILGGAIGDGIKLLVSVDHTPPQPPASVHINIDMDAEQKDQIKKQIKERILDLDELNGLPMDKRNRLVDDVCDILDVLFVFDQFKKTDDKLIHAEPPSLEAHIDINDFVALFVLLMLGIKVLMGGKKRAEALARESQKEAERESLLRQVAEAKIQMMQAQIEPHFLFNTLASVEYLIETDPPRAAAMQHRLIQYLRQVLPKIREHASGNDLGREADMVQAYLDLLKMRMEERLEFKINISEGLRSAAFPPMILQTLVENAIKHGLEPKTEGGLLIVSAEVAHQKLRITVVDNGLGFGMAKSSGTGLGLQNVRERLAFLYKGQSQFLIGENKPSGVYITIEVPYTLAAV
ncbi:sensor histidine kinase [Iodobacter fluviatilis]|uniref:Sensor histidine kinase n=1 Tax=Iodobacter fluviatilis TaxID=537 RepID=A0A7G3G4L9_9NEIS|nr:histidine kinase [Iodobacter fluviatilis]QBC42197.1 sensor histidine kinase [Iodobacter fluviatilis]